MKRVIAEYPYEQYYLYIIFHKKEGRRYANLIPIDKTSNLKRKTISYARYLMSVQEKRILSKNEHVDHKDNDKTNDNIDNLQILSLKENNLKEAKRRGKNMVVLQCPFCHTIFEKEKRQTHLKKGGTFTACSRTCASKFGTLFYYHPDNIQFQNSLKNNIVKEYIKHE